MPHLFNIEYDLSTLSEIESPIEFDNIQVDKVCEILS